MSKKIIETDYLVVGAGAVGMAFADVILTESEHTVCIVDSYAKPGGHWNSAYPFVHLHQPSQFYGVSSKELSQGRLEQGGLNKGLYELASGAEVSAYFDDVMRHQFLPTGRAQYFPMCVYQGEKTSLAPLFLVPAMGHVSTRSPLIFTRGSGEAPMILNCPKLKKYI